MIDKWYSYINRNSRHEKYGDDCQVVTAVNAYYHLTGNKIKHESDDYYELCELAKANWGSAICIEKVHDKLGIEVYDAEKSLYLDRTMVDPIECSVWTSKTGCHSTLIIDHCEKSDAYRVCNLRYKTTTDGWIFSENLREIVSDPNSGWAVRKFRLKK